MSFSTCFICGQVYIHYKQTASFSSNRKSVNIASWTILACLWYDLLTLSLILLRVCDFDDLQYCLTTRKLLTFLLYEIAHLLSWVNINQTTVSSLDYMMFIWDAHAMLPIIGICVCKLVKFALWLIWYVVHALIMSYHLVFLKSNCYKLRVVRIQLSNHFECSFTYNSGSSISIYD